MNSKKKRRSRNNSRRSTMRGPSSTRTEAREDRITSQQQAMPRPVAATSFDRNKWSRIELFVNYTLTEGVQGLCRDFRDKKRPMKMDAERMRTFLEQNPRGRNRYTDVGCLDYTRVVLSDPQDYIHANYVSTPKNPRRFICTQAPLDSTTVDFWRMIVQEGVINVLMLCNMLEKGVKKCFAYFPTQIGQTLDLGDVKVSCTGIGNYKPMTKTRVKLWKTDLSVMIRGRSQGAHACFHYHWQDWPDRGVPDADLTPCLLLKTLENSSGDHPIVVHCSAGVGRTGCMVLIQHLLELLDRDETLPPNCLDLLVRLRDQRHNSVQTEHQYLFVHQVMMTYFSRAGIIDVDRCRERIRTFDREYAKATAGFGN